MYGERIREERKRLHLTQEQLSKKIGISRSNVANWENNQNKPSADMLINLAKFFDCDVSYLAGDSNIRDKYYPTYHISPDIDVNDFKKFLNINNIDTKEYEMFVDFANQIKKDTSLDVYQVDNSKQTKELSSDELIRQYAILFDKDFALTDEQKKFFMDFLEQQHRIYEIEKNKEK